MKNFTMTSGLSTDSLLINCSG